MMWVAWANTNLSNFTLSTGVPLEIGTKLVSLKFLGHDGQHHFGHAGALERRQNDFLVLDLHCSLTGVFYNLKL